MSEYIWVTLYWILGLANIACFVWWDGMILNFVVGLALLAIASWKTAGFLIERS